MNLLQSNLLSDSLSYIDIIKAYAISYIPKIAGAILFYIIGSWIINRLVLLLKKILFKRNYDPSLQTFLVSLVKVVLTILLLISIPTGIYIYFFSFSTNDECFI